MIYIDFQRGAHGHYLEYICNRFIANVQVDGLPFNQFGAAHNRKYKSPRRFRAGHFFQGQGAFANHVGQKIISIRIQHKDLLPLTSVSLLRTKDMQIDNNQLEIDTFNKINNREYKWMLDNINESYFKKQLLEGYNDVKDPSWPNINSLKEFMLLPSNIKKECKEVFSIEPVWLSAKYPDCPRNILREFFKIGFKYPEIHGFTIQQEKMKKYDQNNDIHIFPFSFFYNIDTFINELTNIAAWAGFKPIDSMDDLAFVHDEFLSRQIYKNSKIDADVLFDRIVGGEKFVLPKLTLLEESYLDAQLELYYAKEAPVNQRLWFTTSTEIREHFQ